MGRKQILRKRKGEKRKEERGKRKEKREQRTEERGKRNEKREKRKLGRGSVLLQIATSRNTVIR